MYQFHSAVVTLQHILAHVPTTASSTQFCLLCCLSEPIPKSLAARMLQLTLQDPCRLLAWLRVNRQHLLQDILIFLILHYQAPHGDRGTNLQQNIIKLESITFNLNARPQKQKKSQILAGCCLNQKNTEGKNTLFQSTILRT